MKCPNRECFPISARRLVALRFLVILLTVLQALNVSGQRISQAEISRKMLLHHAANPSPALFVHFDKTIYTNNEDVWFTAYLLKTEQAALVKHSVLSVALVRDLDSVIIKHEKFLIDNGFSFGNMELPDSLVTGNYHFMVTTNRVTNGRPEAFFMQPVVIKTNIELSYKANIKVLSPGVSDKKPTRLSVGVNTADGRLLPGAAEVNYRYGAITRKTKTSSLGEALFDISDQPDLADQNVYVSVKYGKEVNFINIPLNHILKKAKVSFYPEGGNLVTGIRSRVAWEVRDPQGNAVSVKAILFKNGIPVDTIETNRYGTGQFFLSPESANIYSLKLNHNGFMDTTYALPAAKNDGVRLSIAEGAGKGKLMINLAGSKPQNVLLRLHDFVNTFYYSEYAVISGEENFEIPLENCPKGIKTVTVFDTLGRPLAERMVFTNYDPVQKIDITTDHQVYGQRQKVTLNLKLSGTDTVGLVSVACVQDNRLSALLTTDIESYVYLNNELRDIPKAVAGEAYQNKNYVEDILLTKGWRRYTWQDILSTTAADTVKVYENLTTKVKVLNGEKPIKKGVKMVVIGGEGSSKLYDTSDTGEMDISDEDLIIAYGKKPKIASLGRGQKYYNIVVSDPFEQLNKSYVKRFGSTKMVLSSTVQNNSVLSLTNNEKVIRLREVTITAGTGANVDYLSGRNKCGDYVCINNILNCANHPPHKQPVPGTVYRLLDGGTTLYQNCRDNDFIVTAPGIYTQKEFYMNEYKVPEEPAFVSTLYWNHGVLLNSKERQIVFHTGDITGKFRVVVQGVTDNDLIFGQQFFEVRSAVK